MFLKNLSVIFVSIAMISCNLEEQKEFEYNSETLEVSKITENVFLHTSFLELENGDEFPCNGMIYKVGKEVVVFDTPTKNETSNELIKWIESDLKSSVKYVIIHHFHNDCLGGLKAFHDNKIASFASYATIQEAGKRNIEVPKNGFSPMLKLKVGNKMFISEWPGRGHSIDNLISYLPDEKILFGGCLIKEIGAEKGNLNDAYEDDWSETVTKVKSMYKGVEIVVPGHGNVGDTSLLDYTIKLFENSF